MAELHFKRDTEFRKQFFVPNSFAHPAKMDAQLLIWIVEHYTEPGQTILDPMFGSGTTMLACTLGRHVIGVELESKFVDMAKQNWEKVKQRPQLGYAMGTCQILLGDARNLPQVLCDAVITSPPYAEAQIGDDRKAFNPTIQGIKDGKRRGGSLVAKFQAQADVVISSPPYAEARPYHDFDFMNDTAGDQRERLEKGLTKGHNASVEARQRAFAKQASGIPEALSNIGNLAYGSIDAILTSPPYEGSISDQRDIITSIDASKSPDWHPGTYSQVSQPQHYGHNGNIGNLKANSYLAAMLTVYQNCYTVLKEGGLMVLVVKNFIRQKQVIRLDLDTIKLCEQAGFSLVDQYKRKLPGQSFWRTIYKRKYPDVETIDFEDVLVFRKQTG